MNDHRHEWQQDSDGWACVECAETCPSCVVIRKGETHPTGNALLICDGCLIAEGHVLDDIEAAVGHCLWAPGSGQLAAAKYDKDPVHGTGMGEGAPKMTLADVAEVLWTWHEMWRSAWETQYDSN